MIKMELRGEYSRLDSGLVLASLIVTDQGDYVTGQIFNNTEDYPEYNCFKLKKGCSIYIENTFKKGSSASAWMEKQVQHITKLINQWRTVRISSDEVFNI